MEQTGPVISPAQLPQLDEEQLQKLQMAKKYCLDISTRFVSSTASEVVDSCRCKPVCL